MNLPAKFKNTVITIIVMIALLGVILTTAAIVNHKRVLAETRKLSNERLAVFAYNLEAELEKFKELPEVFASFPIFELGLLNPEDEDLQLEMNQKLKSLNVSVNALNTYVINSSGITVASSNWDEPTSFVGENLNFRPYFRDALSDGQAAYFALGTSSNKRGHYYSATITTPESEILGVMVVKVEMDHLEAAWAQSSEHVAVTDEDGIVFISTLPSWRYRPINDLDPDRAREIQESLRYGSAPLEPFDSRVTKQLSESEQVIEFVIEGTSPPMTLLESSVPVNDAKWKIRIYADMQDINSRVQASMKLVGTLALLLLTCLAALANYRWSKRAQKKIEMEMNEQLRVINDQLEVQVTARTNELSMTNRKLTDEITERKQTETELRETQDQLVQAAKMAALGQMATSITHELNQPLGAIRTFTDTAQTYLSMDDKAMVNKNLGMIGTMTERMGDIMQHLKAFARKTPPDIMPVSIDQAVNETLIVLTTSIAESNASVNYSNNEPGLHVLAEPIRLQQILTNLVQNALDSMCEKSTPTVDIHVQRIAETVTIDVRDYGCGLSENIRDRLFEPFHTTKSQGDGLGLGLAITYGLVKSFNGNIVASNASGGGALFRLTLNVAVVDEAIVA